MQIGNELDHARVNSGSRQWINWIVLNVAFALDCHIALTLHLSRGGRDGRKLRQGRGTSGSMDGHVGAPVARTPGMNEHRHEGRVCRNGFIAVRSVVDHIVGATPRVHCQLGERR